MAVTVLEWRYFEDFDKNYFSLFVEVLQLKKKNYLFVLIKLGKKILIWKGCDW